MLTLAQARKQEEERRKKGVSDDTSYSDSEIKTLAELRREKQNNTEYDAAGWFGAANNLINEVSKYSRDTNYEFARNSGVYSNRLNGLKNEKAIDDYVESLKGTAQYKPLKSQLNAYKKNLGDLAEYTNNLNAFASNYDNEDDYNRAVTEINRSQKYAALKTYDDFVKASKATFDDDERRWLVAKGEEVATADDIQKAYDTIKHSFGYDSKQETALKRLEALKNKKITDEKIAENYTNLNPDIRNILDKYYYATKSGKKVGEMNPDEAPILSENEEFNRSLKDNNEETLAKAKADYESLADRGYDIDELFKWYSRGKEREKTEKYLKEQTELANQNAGAQTVASLGTILAHPIAAANTAGEYINAGVNKATNSGDDFIDPETTTVNSIAEIRRGISEKLGEGSAKLPIIGNVASFLYDTGMSTGDFLSLLPLNTLPGGQAVSLGIMSTEAGTQAANEALKNGSSLEQAMATGVASGIAEAFFEKFSIEQLKAFKQAGSSSVKDVVSNTLKGMVTEGSEEVFTDFANLVSDNIINGDISQFSQNKNDYIKQGYSEEEAELKAWQDFGSQLVQSFSGGALSGGAMNLGAAGMNYTSNVLDGSEIKQNNNADTLANIAKLYQNDDNVAKLSRKLERSKVKGKDYSSSKLGQLRHEVMAAAAKASQSESNKAVERYVNSSNLSTEEKAVANKFFNGTELTQSEVDLINNSANLKNIISTMPETGGEHTANYIKALSSVKVELSKVKMIDYNKVNTEGMPTQEALKASAEAQGFNSDTTQAFVNNYDKSLSVDQYTQQFMQYHNLGRVLGPMDALNNSLYSLSNQAKLAAYESGKNVYVEHAKTQYALTQAQQEWKKTQGGYTEGTVDKSGIDESKLNQNQRDSIEYLSAFAKFGVNVKFYKSKHTLGKLVDPNGYYDPETHTIGVAVDSMNKRTGDSAVRGAMLATFAHELTHVSERAPELYTELRENVSKAFGAKWESTVNVQLKNLKQNHPDIVNELSEEELTERASQEALAECCSDMLNHSDILEKMAQENPKALGKVIEVVRKVINRLRELKRELFKEDDTNKNYRAAEAKYLQQQIDDMQKVVDLWEKTVTEGIKNQNARQAVKEKNSDTGVQEQLRNIPDEKTIEKNIELVANMESVISLSGEEFKKGKIDLITQVSKYFETIGGKVSTEYGIVSLNEQSARDSLAHGIGRNKAIAFKAVPFVLKKGKIIDFQKKWKGNESRVAFAAPITIANVPHYMVAIVQVFDENNHFYLHEVALQEKGDSAFKTGTAKSGTPSAKSPSIFSLLKKLQDVNQNSAQKSSKDFVQYQGRNTEQIDRDYLTAVERGDLDTAQRMVDEAAQEAGYSSPLTLYHGTNSFGFTEFDLNKMDDRTSIFLSSTEETASTYSGVRGIRKVSDSPMSYERLSGKEVAEYLNNNQDEFDKEYDTKYIYYDEAKVNGIIEKTSNDLKWLVDTIDSLVTTNKQDNRDLAALKSIKRKIESKNYSGLSANLYMLLYKSDVFSNVDTQIAKIEENVRLSEKLQEHSIENSLPCIVKDSLDGYVFDILTIEEARSRLKDKVSSGNYAFYVKFENPMLIDDPDMQNNWNSIRVPKRYQQDMWDYFGEQFSATNTRKFAEYAKARGYDAVVFENIRDNGGKNPSVENAVSDVYVVFDSAQVKSADAVTYDDNGEVIPLSERFKAENKDIRYQDRASSSSFNRYAVSTAIWDALDHNDKGDDNLIKVGEMPRYIQLLLGISGDFYIQRNHTYENTVTEEQAKEEGRYNSKAHYHGYGVEKMERAMLAIEHPIMTINDTNKYSNPTIVMILDEFGENNTPLYAVLSFYSDKTINGKLDQKPHVVLTIAERAWYAEGGRDGYENIIKKAIESNKVIDYDKKKRNELSVIAENVNLGNITSSFLNHNLSQLKKEINSFKQKNNIKYQDREGIKTEADYLNKAAEGSPDFDLFDFDDTDDDLFENEDNAIDFDKMVRDDPQQALELMYKSIVRQARETLADKDSGLTENSYRKIARKLIPKYAVENGHLIIITNIIRNFIENTDSENFEEKFTDFVLEMKNVLLYSNVLDETSAERIKNLRDDLQGTTLLIPKDEEAAIRSRYESVANYRNKLFGWGVNVAIEGGRGETNLQGKHKAVTIKDLIESLRDNLGEAYSLGDDIDGGNAFLAFEEYLHSVQPLYYNPYLEGLAENIDVAAIEMAADVITEYTREKGRAATVNKNGNIAKLRDRLQKAEEQRDNLMKAGKENARVANDIRKYKNKLEKFNEETNKLDEINWLIKSGYEDDTLFEKRESAENAVDKASKELFKLRSTEGLKRAVDERIKSVVSRERRRQQNIADKLQEHKDKIRNLKAEWREARELTEVVDKIRKLQSKMSTALRHPTANVYVPDAFATAYIEACTAITEALENGKMTKANLNLKTLLIELDKLNNSDTEYNGEVSQQLRENLEYVIEMVGLLDKQLRELDGKPINTKNLTLNQANNIYTVLYDIYNTVQDATKQLDRADVQTNYESGEKLNNNFNEAEKFAKKAKLKDFKNYALNGMRLARFYSGYNDNSEIMYHVNALNEGQRKANRYRMEADKKFFQLTEKRKAEYKRSRNEIVNVEYKLNNGENESISLSRMTALQILMTWSREQSSTNLVHMEKSGFMLPDAEFLRKGKVSDAIDNSTRVEGVNTSLITALEGILTDFEQEYRKIAEEYFNDYSKKAINEISNIIKHRSIAMAEYYIPIVVDKNYLQTELEELKLDRTLEGMGMLKSTVRKAPQPLIITSLNSVIARHINDVSKFYGLAVPTRNFKKALNISFRNEEGGKTGSVRDTIQKVWGKNTNKFFNRLIADLESSRYTDNDASNRINNAIKGLRNAMVVKTLTANISVVIKQAASYPTAGVYLSHSALMKGLASSPSLFKPGNYQKLIDEIDEHTAQHYMRRLGLSQQELAELMDSWRDKIPTALNPAKWIQGVDCITTALLWNACKSEIKRSGMSENTESFFEEVTRLYDKVIENTQPMYDSLHRTELQKTTNEVWKSIFMFKTQPLQNTGIIYDSFGDAFAHPDSKEKRNIAIKAVSSQVISLAVFAGMSALAALAHNKLKRYKDDDDEVTMQSVLNTIFGDMLTNGVGVAVPIFGNELFEKLKSTFSQNSGYDTFSMPLLDMMNDTINATQETYDEIVNMFDTAQYGYVDPATIISSANNLGVQITGFFGIPTQNVENILNGIFSRFSVDFFSKKSERTTKSYIESYGNHFTEGDTEKAQEQLNTLYQNKYDKYIEKGENSTEAQKKARTDLRTSLSNTYKLEYQKAFLKNDSKRMQEISSLLNASGYMVYDNKLLSQVLLDWRKSAQNDVQKNIK